MTIEQTRWFFDEVKFMVERGKEQMYLTTAREFADGHMRTLVRERGIEAAKKAAAKANRSLHKKFYVV